MWTREYGKRSVVTAAVWAVAAAATGQTIQVGGPGNLYAIDFGNGNLYRLNETTAELGLIGGTGLVDPGGLEFAPDGTLYATTHGSNGGLYRIDPFTAAATLVGGFGRFTFEGSIAFSADRAFVASGGSAGDARLFTVDLSNGQLTEVGSMGQGDFNGLVVRPSDGRLIGLDRVGQRLVVIDPATAATTTLRSFSPAIGALGGMTVLDGVGYFATGGTAGSFTGTNSLYSFDLETGQASLVGAFAGLSTPGLGGIAAVPEPGTLLAVGAGLAALARRRRNRRDAGNAVS